MKKRILIICPTSIDRRELGYNYTAPGYEFIFHWYESTEFDLILHTGIPYDSLTTNPQVIIDDICLTIGRDGIDGIITSDDYPGCVLAACVAQHMNVIGPDIYILLLAQNKYYARVSQQKYVPHATPQFDVIEPASFQAPTIDFPVFIKPVKSFFSAHAHPVETLECLNKIRSSAVIPEPFQNHFDWFFKTYLPQVGHTHSLLVEQFLEGIQVTVEGYSYNNHVEIIGVVDSVMYPRTYSFERFEYPSQLSQVVQERMHEIARTYINGVNLTNTLFNIEMMYNPETDQIHIIELNTRMASQFADLYYKIDGVSSYHIACDIAVGKQPKPIIKNAGLYKHAASFVLRTFKNQRVIQVPTELDIQKIYELYPDVRVYIPFKVGMLLSDELQDGRSYRYGLIHLGHQSRQLLQQAFEECKRLLPFTFSAIE